VRVTTKTAAGKSSTNQKLLTWRKEAAMLNQIDLISPSKTTETETNTNRGEYDIVKLPELEQALNDADKSIERSMLMARKLKRSVQQLGEVKAQLSVSRQRLLIMQKERESEKDEIAKMNENAKKNEIYNRVRRFVGRKWGLIAIGFIDGEYWVELEARGMDYWTFLQFAVTLIEGHTDKRCRFDFQQQCEQLSKLEEFHVTSVNAIEGMQGARARIQTLFLGEDLPQIPTVVFAARPWSVPVFRSLLCGLDTEFPVNTGEIQDGFFFALVSIWFRDREKHGDLTDVEFVKWLQHRLHPSGANKVASLEFLEASARYQLKPIYYTQSGRQHQLYTLARKAMQNAFPERHLDFGRPWLLGTVQQIRDQNEEAESLMAEQKSMKIPSFD
jgi:hypothetical protein